MVCSLTEHMRVYLKLQASYPYLMWLLYQAIHISNFERWFNFTRRHWIDSGRQPIHFQTVNNILASIQLPKSNNKGMSQRPDTIHISLVLVEISLFVHFFADVSLSVQWLLVVKYFIKIKITHLPLYISKVTFFGVFFLFSRPKILLVLKEL